MSEPKVIKKWAIITLVSLCQSGLMNAQEKGGDLEMMTQSYRLLRVDRIDFRNNLHYAISVDNRLATRQEFENLVCAVVETEKPQNYRSLDIDIFYQLDKYVPAIGHPPSLKNEKHILGTYRWHRGLPGNKYALSIYRDAAGNWIRDGQHQFPFDHFKDCKK